MGFPLYITTTTANNITTTTADSGGQDITYNAYTASEKGVCWSSINEYPTIEIDDHDGIPVVGNNADDYVISMTGLTPDTLYYYRAYVIQNLGTSYATELTFTTESAPSTPKFTIVGGNFLTFNGQRITFTPE